MQEMPTFHVMDRRLPVGIPLFASWWWRVMAVGASLGLLPVLAVMWSFIDAPFGRFMGWIWPAWLVRLGDLGSPTLWLVGGASVYLLAASLRHRAAARWSFLLIASVATALVVSGVFGGMLWTGRAWHAAGDAPDWNALWPDARCAAIAAAAFTLWVRLQGFGRVLPSSAGVGVVGGGGVCQWLEAVRSFPAASPSPSSLSPVGARALPSPPLGQSEGAFNSWTLFSHPTAGGRRVCSRSLYSRAGRVRGRSGCGVVAVCVVVVGGGGGCLAWRQWRRRRRRRRFLQACARCRRCSRVG